MPQVSSRSALRARAVFAALLAAADSLRPPPGHAFALSVQTGK